MTDLRSFVKFFSEDLYAWREQNRTCCKWRIMAGSVRVGLMNSQVRAENWAASELEHVGFGNTQRLRVWEESNNCGRLFLLKRADILAWWMKCLREMRETSRQRQVESGRVDSVIGKALRRADEITPSLRLSCFDSLSPLRRWVASFNLIGGCMLERGKSGIQSGVKVCGWEAMRQKQKKQKESWKVHLVEQLE